MSDGPQRPVDETEPAKAPPREVPPTADDGADGAEQSADRAGLRLIAAIVTLPWLVLYGITGVWAVAFAARTASEGLKQVDAGYTRYVTPAQLAYVGVLLIVAFAVMLAGGLLLLFRKGSAAVWLPLLLIALGLTAGAIWAGVEGGLHPLLWVLLFFGLVYVVVVAAVKVLHVTRAERRGTIAPP